MPICEEFNIVEILAEDYKPFWSLKRMFHRKMCKVSVTRIERFYRSIPSTHTQLINDKLVKAEIIIPADKNSVEVYSVLNQLILDETYFNTNAKVVKLDV
jgi:hypothetical protein